MNFVEELLKNKDKIVDEAIKKQEEEERQKQEQIENSIDDVISEVKKCATKCLASYTGKGKFIKIEYRYRTWDPKKWTVWSKSSEVRTEIRDRLRGLGFTHVSVDYYSEWDSPSVPELLIKLRITLGKE